MRISDALGERIPLAVHFPSGDVLNIVYTPMSYTVAELEELQRSERDVARIISSVRRLVLEWDLTDDDGVPIPLQHVTGMRVVTEDGGTVWEPDPDQSGAVLPSDPLRHVPTNIFMQIFRAVNDDQTPGGSKA